MWEGARDDAYLDNVSVAIWRITAEGGKRQKDMNTSRICILVTYQLLEICIAVSPELCAGETSNLWDMLKLSTSTEMEKSGTSSWGSNVSSEEAKRTGCCCGSSENRKSIWLHISGVLPCGVVFTALCWGDSLAEDWVSLLSAMSSAVLTAVLWRGRLMFSYKCSSAMKTC